MIKPSPRQCVGAVAAALIPRETLTFIENQPRPCDQAVIFGGAPASRALQAASTYLDEDGALAARATPGVEQTTRHARRARIAPNRVA